MARSNSAAPSMSMREKRANRRAQSSDAVSLKRKSSQPAPAMTTSRKPYESLLRSAPYWAATLLDFAAMSRSITVRQPALNSARCLNMHAVIFGMSGISELHRRNASPVHICWASALNAKLDVDDSDDKETATASTRPAWRSAVAKDEDILGSRCGAG